MIDKEFFKQILSQDDEGYIDEHDYIDWELMEIFINSSPSKVAKLFKKIDFQKDRIQFSYEIKCEKCGTIEAVSTSKTKLIDVLSDYRKNKKIPNKVWCSSCLKQETEERKKIDTERHVMAEEIKIQNTKNYIEWYLNTDRSWNPGVKNSTKIGDLRVRNICQETIKEKIISMSYSDFLKTPYWKAIAERIKIKAGFKCQLCNSVTNLSAHHRSYQHHGDEINHLEDLICICQDCHSKYHGHTNL